MLAAAEKYLLRLALSRSARTRQAHLHRHRRLLHRLRTGKPRASAQGPCFALGPHRTAKCNGPISYLWERLQTILTSSAIAFPTCLSEVPAAMTRPRSNGQTIPFGTLRLSSPAARPPGGPRATAELNNNTFSKNDFVPGKPPLRKEQPNRTDHHIAPSSTCPS